MRIMCHLGDLKVAALVDTGSDFDAIDADLAKYQESKGNPAFISRSQSASIPVSGFATSMKCQTDTSSRWMVTFTGSEVLHGPVVQPQLEFKFSEFLELGDPLIFGMPSVDNRGGIESLGASHVWIAGLWIPRWHRRDSNDSAVRSISALEVQPQNCLRHLAPQSCQDILVDEHGWYPMTTYWDSRHLSDLFGNNQPCWLGSSPDCPADLEVLNSVVSPFLPSGVATMDILVKARPGHVVSITSNASICQLRLVDEDCIQALQDFQIAKGTREVEQPDPLDVYVPIPGCSGFTQSTGVSPSAPETTSGGREVNRLIYNGSHDGGFASESDSCAPIAYSINSVQSGNYKIRNRTDQQARLFPELEKEIADRRMRLNADVRDQKSAQYKAEICEKVKKLQLCPEEHFDLLCERILKPFSDRFWDEGCEAPAIKGFKASISLKPGAKIPFRQPYRLSKFDETRLSYLYEEAEKEGKAERFELGAKPPCCCTPVFVVDKKGSLIGRKVGDFRGLNNVTEDYYYPAPEADTCLMEACGKKYHTLFDCVWGFEQIDVDDATAELLSTITPFGTFKSKKLPMGVKQGPAIYQHMQDSAFCNESKPNGDKLCHVYFDDTHMCDNTIEEHFASIAHVLTVARKYNIQYRLTKCNFVQPEVLLLGFHCSLKGRTADPKKIEQLRSWPAYRGCADIVSHLAFCNYLREYYGPDYSEKTLPLKKYL